MAGRGSVHRPGHASLCRTSGQRDARLVDATPLLSIVLTNGGMHGRNTDKMHACLTIHPRASRSTDQWGSRFVRNFIRPHKRLRFQFCGSELFVEGPGGSLHYLFGLRHAVSGVFAAWTEIHSCLAIRAVRRITSKRCHARCCCSVRLSMPAHIGTLEIGALGARIVVLDQAEVFFVLPAPNAFCEPL